MRARRASWTNRFEKPVQIDSILRIASMTKAVTSVAVMQLVEQGKVDLDQPIANYVPRFADVQVLEGFGADGEPILRDPKSLPTIRQLLSHTSGYVYDLWNANAARMVSSGAGCKRRQWR